MENYKPTKEELEKAIEIFMLRDKIIKWRELPQGIYYISDVKPNKYGHQLFLSNYQEEYIVWSPSKMNKELSKNVEYHFVKNNGIRISKNNREYFHYNLV